MASEIICKQRKEVKKYLVIMVVVILAGIRCTIFIMSLDDHSIHPISHDRMSVSLSNRLRHLYSSNLSTPHNINPLFTSFVNSSPSFPPVPRLLSSHSNINLTTRVYRVQQKTASSKTRTTSNSFSGRPRQPSLSTRLKAPPKIPLHKLLALKSKSNLISQRVLQSLSTHYENTSFAFKPTPLSHRLSVFNNSLPTSSLIAPPYSQTANPSSPSQPRVLPDYHNVNPLVDTPRLNKSSNSTFPTATVPFFPPLLYDSTYNFSRPSSTTSAASSLLLPSALARQCYTYNGLTAKNNCCHTDDFRANKSTLLLQCLMSAATSPKHK